MRSYERCWKVVLKTDFESLFFTNLKVKKYRNLCNLNFVDYSIVCIKYNRKYKE